MTRVSFFFNPTKYRAHKWLTTRQNYLWLALDEQMIRTIDSSQATIKTSGPMYRLVMSQIPKPGFGVLEIP